MKVLVATERTQGNGSGDFTFCVAGELVYLGLVCDTDRLYPESGCGCSRAFSGLSSAKATTSAEVAEVEFSVAEYIEAVASGLDRQGWGAAAAPEVVEELLAIVGPLPVGTVVGRRFDEVIVRQAVVGR
jgi:hypothetical protein